MAPGQMGHGKGANVDFDGKAWPGLHRPSDQSSQKEKKPSRRHEWK